MLPEVTSVNTRAPYKLELTFNDGTAGTVDISRLLNFEGVFRPLAEPEYFRQACLDSGLGTACWPNGADIDPLVLHAIANGEITEEEFAAKRTLPGFDAAAYATGRDPEAVYMQESLETYGGDKE